jgi:uncharacterized protein YuzE
VRHCTLRVRIDGIADAAYICLRKIEPGGVAYTVPVEFDEDEGPRFGSIYLDFDANNTLIGIEVLGPAHILPPEVLEASLGD